MNNLIYLRSNSDLISDDVSIQVYSGAAHSTPPVKPNSNLITYEISIRDITCCFWTTGRQSYRKPWSSIGDLNIAVIINVRANWKLASDNPINLREPLPNSELMRAVYIKSPIPRRSQNLNKSVFRANVQGEICSSLRM